MAIKSADQGEKKVQAQVKMWMEYLESMPGWKELPPTLSNDIRHALVRAAWSTYKIGLLLG